MIRLLRSLQSGGFELASFDDEHAPPYAILSHTWEDGQEVTYNELLAGTGTEKSGYAKLRFCGERATVDGLEYFWVDTCCINKATSDELSMAINSMFRWYQGANKCYVFLTDVSISDEELLAPASVEFFSREGKRLGSRISLEQEIYEITRIPKDALRGRRLDHFHVEDRMSWAAGRTTTKKEDRVYCLLGIFGVYLPLIYGEGEVHATSRLREELYKQHLEMKSIGKHGAPSSPPEHDAAKRRRIDAYKVPYRGLADDSMEAQYSSPAGVRFQSGSLLKDEEKSLFLKSLRFKQIDAREMTIKTAHAKTCRWLLTHPQYLEWLDPTKLHKHHGFLWIKGKAGAGKSTLMKNAMINARKTINDRTTIAFFFNARGEEVEKSTVGTYRSLLLQLLEHVPSSQSVFDSLEVPTSSLTTDHCWDIESLKTLLTQAVSALRSRKCFVLCFIDALDECEEDKVRDMIQFFEHIGDLARTDIRFQVCLSSRHYPHITIRNGLELVLEGQEGHTRDLTDYIETELKIGNSKKAQQIRHELQEKASGIFMWVVLVVGILNKQSDRGQVHTLQRKLREIPSDLGELFRNILTRDTHNEDGLISCIQWILFAKQPLNPRELYHAILASTDPEAVTEWDSEEINEDVLKRFILDSSKGLAEVVASWTVQFIHESVKDFLLKENGLGRIWPELKNNFEGQGHERLKQGCLRYISINISTPPRLRGHLPKASSLEETGLPQYPFLKYAVHNILYHADTAQAGSISQASFLDSFPIRQWMRLHNLFEEHDAYIHTENVSLLYMLAELNAANLIRVHPSVNTCLDVEDERYGCAFLAANATGSQEAMQACIEGLEWGQSALDQCKSQSERNSVQRGVERSLGHDFRFFKEEGVFLYAVEIGSAAVVDYLMRSGNFDPNSKYMKRPILSAALQVAAFGGHEDIARLLLDKGADVNAQDSEVENALHAASGQGHERIARLLVDNGADVNAEGGVYGNALLAASQRGHERIVKLLLDKGANVNVQDGYYGNALQAASEQGYERITKLLLDRGAHANAHNGQGGYYGTALPMASERRHKRTTRPVLDKGADDVPDFRTMDHEEKRGLLQSILELYFRRGPQNQASSNVKAADAWLRADAFLQPEDNSVWEEDPELKRGLDTFDNLLEHEPSEEGNSVVHKKISERKRENDVAIEALEELDQDAKKRRFAVRENPTIDDGTLEPDAEEAIEMRKRCISLHLGLQNHWMCVCHKCSGLSLRLSLPQQKTSSQGETCFEVFFVVRDSSRKHSLQAAKITVKDGLNHKTMGRQPSPAVFSECVNICQSVTESLNQGRGLSLLFENDLFKKLRPPPRHFGNSPLPRAISLSTLFERQRGLIGGASVLPLKGKRILASVLAAALLPFLETPWIQPSFTHSSILFFQSREGELPNITEPFLDIQQAPAIASDRRIFRDSRSEQIKNIIHPNASVLALGILLCELHYCKPIESWQDNSSMTRELNARYYTSLDVLRKLKADAGIDYYLATKACLHWEYYPIEEPAQGFESTSVQRLFHQNVVKRLESVVSRSWDLHLEDLKSLDPQVNELCWGPIGRDVVYAPASDA